MAEGAPHQPLIEVSAPVEAAQVSGEDVAVTMAVTEDAAAGGTSLHEALPDRSPGRVRMAAGGVVHGEIVEPIQLAAGMEGIL